MAQHGSPGRRDVRQRQRVRGGSGRHQERRELVLEDFGQAALQPFRDRILAVAEREAVVGAADRREDRGRDPGGIVAGEMHASLPSYPGRSAAGGVPIAHVRDRDLRNGALLNRGTPLRGQPHCAQRRIRVPLVASRNPSPQQSARKRPGLPGRALRPRPRFDILGQRYCPNWAVRAARPEARQNVRKSAPCEEGLRKAVRKRSRKGPRLG